MHSEVESNENVINVEQEEVKNRTESSEVDSNEINENEAIMDDEVAKLLEDLEASKFNATEVIDPIKLAIEQKENELQSQLNILEQTLRSERLIQSNLKDKLSESGKMGFYMIQAKVTDFQVNIIIQLIFIVEI